MVGCRRILEVVEDDRIARARAEQNRGTAGSKDVAPTRATTLQEYFAQAKAGKAKKLLLIVKADNQGTLPPIAESLDKLNLDDNEVKLEVIYKGIASRSRTWS